MAQLSDPVVIGFIGAPHGVRGTVRVRAAGMGQHLREDVEPIVDGARQRISQVRPTPKGYLVDLEGVTDRSQATKLRGKELVLERRELDDLEEDEFYVGDLIGMTAVDETESDVGVVDEVIETPAHEILLVRNADGELYVPFTLEHVPAVDLERRRITVDLPQEA